MFALALHRRAHVVIVGFVVDVEVLLALRGIVRTGREHADDLRLLDGEIERLADHVRIAAEDPPPVRVGEHGDRRRALRVIRLHQHPSILRMRAEHLEEVRRHQSAGGAMRLAAAEHVEGPVAELNELIDRLRLAAIIGDLREREARVLDAGGGLHLPQVHDAIGVRIRQRPQQHAVDDAEDRGVRADAEPQRQDESDRKPGQLRQVADSNAKVVEHGRHPS